MALLNKAAQDVLDDVQADVVEAAKSYLSSALEYLEEARNVLDTDVKDRIVYLVSRYTDNATVLTWFTSQYRRWLVNEGPATRITELGDGAPDWAKAALAKDGEIYKINWIDVANQLPILIDYIRYEVGQSNNISKLSVPDAMIKQEAWHEKLKAANAVFSMEDGIAEELKCSNGLTWYSLTGQASLDREGELMGHCVGSYYSEVQSNRKQIFTLRDAKNIPHVTVEVTRAKIKQIKGKANLEVVEKYRSAILDFFAHKEWEEINLDECGITKPDTIEFLKSKNMFKVLGEASKNSDSFLGTVTTSKGEVTVHKHVEARNSNKGLTKPLILTLGEYARILDDLHEVHLKYKGKTSRVRLSYSKRMDMFLKSVESDLGLKFEGSDLKSLTAILRIAREADACNEISVRDIRPELFGAFCDEGSDVIYTKPKYATVRRILSEDLVDFLAVCDSTRLRSFRSSPEYVVFDFGSPIIRMYRDTNNKMWGNSSSSAKKMVLQGSDFTKLTKVMPGKTDFSGLTRTDRVAMELSNPKSKLLKDPEMSKRATRGLLNHTNVTKTSPIYKAIKATLNGGGWYVGKPEDFHGIAKQLDKFDMKKVFRDNKLRMSGYSYGVWPSFTCLLLMKNKEKQIEYIFKSAAALKALVALFAGQLPFSALRSRNDTDRLKMRAKAIKGFDLTRSNIKHLIPLTPGEVKIITGGAMKPAARKFINMEYLGMSEAEAKKKNKV